MATPFQIAIGHRRQPVVGWMWHLSAAATAVVILLMWPQDVPAVGPMALGLIIGPLLLYRQGHRHFVPSAADVEATDARAPFLYLRSFEIDQRLDVHEEALARLFAPDGPFLAIGDPHAPLPSLAAARDFLPADQWKDVVLERMERARLILLVAGSTPGLAWEIEQCRRVGRPSKLVVIVPTGAENYAAFCGLCQLTGLPLPGYDVFDGARGPIAGVIAFDGDWQPHTRDFAQITVLDPMFMFDAEAASWRVTLNEVAPYTGLHPSEPAYRIAWSQHWRLLPLAMLTWAALMLARQHL